MNKLALVAVLNLTVCLMGTNSFAGDYVFHTNEVITGKRSSCGKSCSIRSDSLKVDKATFDSITRWHKVANGVVVEMTQAEKDVILQAEIDLQDLAEVNKLIDLDDKLVNVDMSIVLTKVDNKIDNIGDLNDAKVFLKRLVRYIIAIQ